MSEKFAFLTAAEIRFGRGCAHDVAGAVRALGGRIFLVTGANVARAAWLASDLSPVGRFSAPYEPDLALISAGVAAARAAGAEVIVALGGGAVIDTAKAIAALVPTQRPILDHLEVVGQGAALDFAPLPFVAITTTAGTGAEVTKNAVIGVPEAQRKVSLRDDRMLANLAVVDPSLTDGTPRHITLASGLDAVTQVIEPYVCTRANRLTDALCRDAIGLGLSALVGLMQQETAQGRDDLAWVSLCGGLALANSGLGAVHGLAGPIGGVIAAPHGAICGALLPHVLIANETRATGQALARLQELRGVIGLALGCDAAGAFDALRDWSLSHGLPGLGAMGLAPSHFAGVAEAALVSSSMKANPTVLQRDDLIEILKAAL